MKNEPDEQHNTRMGESMEITEADKKGKGSGTKDACYHKVKSRYSVWPSAYASGALVKCRKVGAANWGNKSESVEVTEAMTGYEKARKAAARRAAERNRLRKAGKMGGNMERETYTDESGTRMHYKGYKAEEVEVDEAMAMKPSNMKKKAKLGAALDRLQALKVAKKKKEMGEEIENEGMQYGIFKGDGKPKGAMAAFGKKDKAKKDKKIKMEALSNWKEDYVWEADEEQMEKEVKEKKVKNKIIINPKLGEAVEELGGKVLEIKEMEDTSMMNADPQIKSKQNRQKLLKKQVLLRKLQAVRQGAGEDITASYQPEGEEINEIGVRAAIVQAANVAKSAAKKVTQSNLQKKAMVTSPAIKSSDTVNEEQLDEYGNPRVGLRLRAARAIDSVNPRPKVGSKRTAISNKLKMSAIKAETKRREQKENPYSAGKKVRMALGMSNEDYIPEEGYDHYKDRIAMAGGDPSSPDKKDATTMPRKSEPMKGMTAAQKAAKGKSALDIVKADIRKKYGKGAIMGESENQMLTKLRQKFMKFTRLNKNFKIPLPGGGSIDSAARKANKYDAATGGEFSKFVGSQ